MDTAQDQGSLLETMEESQNQVPYDKEIRTAKMEGARDGELQKRDMEVCNHAKQCADQNRNSQSGVHIHDRLLSESM